MIDSSHDPLGLSLPASVEGTLGARLDERDSSGFVGREAVMSRFERFFTSDAGASVLFVHGRAGVGKSAVVREATRRAVSSGYAVVWVDGRQPSGALAQIEELPRSATGRRLLLVVDSYERFSGIGAHLRTHVLVHLPSTSRIVLVGRRPPDPGWHEGGWDAVVDTLPVEPLGEDEARELLARRGVTETEAVSQIVRWARGEPLALVVAAQRFRSETDWSNLASDSDLVETLAQRLVGDDPISPDDDVLAVASIAIAVDSGVLEHVVEGVDGEAAIRSLRELPFAEDLGDRVTLHERVGAAVHDQLRRTNPIKERNLRRLLADYFRERARFGDLRYLVEMGALFEDPNQRWAWAADGTGEYHTDRVRPGDGTAAAEALGATGATWWIGVERWLDDAPQCVTTVRDTKGSLCGLCILMTPETAPSWASEDPVAGPLLDYAKLNHRGATPMIGRELLGFPAATSADPTQPMVRAFQGALLLLDTLDVDVLYGVVAKGNPTAAALADVWGAVPIPGMELKDHERTMEVRALRFEHGIIDTYRSMVYRELGVELPSPEGSSEITVETVRHALRHLFEPDVLSSSALARGSTVAERAESVREVLHVAANSCFSEAPRDQLMRRVLELGYLEPSTTHEAAARRLHLGRSTYFAHLRKAVERVTQHLVATDPSDVPRA